MVRFFKLHYCDVNKSDYPRCTGYFLSKYNEIERDTKIVNISTYASGQLFHL